MSTTIQTTIISIAIFITIINEITSSPSGMYLQLNENFRTPTIFKRFLDIPEALKGFVDHATSAVQEVPKQIKNFFYPDPEIKEGRARHNEALSSTKESGQWDFFGREWLKHLGKAVDSIGNKFGHSTTRGLDTNKNFFSGYASFDFMKEIKAIVPGTHFCGQGDVAGDKKELGYFSDTDACCRQHDGCAEYILPGKLRNGLENSGLFTRSRCECDKKFYNCLKNVGGVLATKIGFTFFTVLGPQCFKEEYPITKCSKSSWGRCIKYEFDKSQEKRPQWFDNPIY